MTNHSPKTGALMAYESGALSAAGRARLERHLRSCSVCQRELAVIQTYEATVDAIRDDRGPDLDWSKMELALEREAQVQAKKHRRGWVVPAVGVALAAAAAVLLAMPTDRAGTEPSDHGGGTYVVDRHVPVAPPLTGGPSLADRPVDAFASAIVTLVAGDSQILGGSVERATVGMALSDGDVIATSEASSLHARLAEDVAVALEPGGRLRLASLDDEPGVPAAALEDGRVTVRGARTVILAGQFRIEAEVASFRVDFDEPTLALDVREGEVHLTGPGVDERLTGPARYPSDAAALEGAEPVTAALAYETLPSVTITRPEIVRWQLGDVSAVGSDHIAMRVGTGPLAISAWDARGRMFRATVTVGAEGLDLAPDELAPTAPRIHAGTLGADEWHPVVLQHQRELQRCYEHELRGTPQLSVHVVAQISVEMTGSVADDGVRFDGDPMPPSMARCMSDRIQTWIFPAPHGGPVTIPARFGFAPQ